MLLTAAIVIITVPPLLILVEHCYGCLHLVTSVLVAKMLNRLSHTNSLPKPKPKTLQKGLRWGLRL